MRVKPLVDNFIKPENQHPQAVWIFIFRVTLP